MALTIPRSVKVLTCVSHLPGLSSLSSVSLPPPTKTKSASLSHSSSSAPLSLLSLLDDEPRTVKKSDDGRRTYPPPTSATPKIKRAEAVDTRSFPFAEKSFTALKLSRFVHERLAEEGLEVPTDVQVAAIPVILDGHDAAIQSFTGSGKTLAYLLPILSRVGPLRHGDDELTSEQQQIGSKGSGVEVVIVVPSRELAIQIVREAERILSPEYRKTIQQLIGGANPNRQEEALKKNKPLIIVGTPGRISELSRAGKLHTHSCRFLVLDEADQLLSSKFRDDMRRILEHVGQRRSSPQTAEAEVATQIADSTNAVEKKEKRKTAVERQTLLVSATMPAPVLRAAATWGQKPLLVRATSIIDVESPGTLSSASEMSTDKAEAELKGARESLPPNLEHFYVMSPLHHRVDNLRKCIHALEAQSVIVFMNHSRRLKDTEFKLTARGIAAGTLSGELNKLERGSVLSAFRSGKLRVLVVSEVGARGLDVPACDLVVNLELPTDGSHYAHRGGRTGRLGRRGTVISICEGSEEFVIQKFERQLAISIPRADLYDGKLLPWEKARSRKESTEDRSTSVKVPRVTK